MLGANWFTLSEIEVLENRNSNTTAQLSNTCPELYVGSALLGRF